MPLPIPLTIPSAERDWTNATEDELLAAYREMAADEEREKEAADWSETLIGDSGSLSPGDA